MERNRTQIFVAPLERKPTWRPSLCQSWSRRDLGTDKSFGLRRGTDPCKRCHCRQTAATLRLNDRLALYGNSLKIKNGCQSRRPRGQFSENSSSQKTNREMQCRPLSCWNRDTSFHLLASFAGASSAGRSALRQTKNLGSRYCPRKATVNGPALGRGPARVKLCL